MRQLNIRGREMVQEEDLRESWRMTWRRGCRQIIAPAMNQET
ncbi:hypothetical protein [Prosthecobacter sp.]